MKTPNTLLRTATTVLCAVLLLVPQAFAAPVSAPGFSPPSPVVRVSADCYAIGQQVAAQNGGTLAKASPSTQGGQPVCVIVVLVPGKDGERPRRAEFVVPQG
ncbi:hypothetical protein [Pseudaminobacter sp. NGMCC 1.201702]|uniref:hypothetical protein n=1 Tax=Pseudaminobacter sp. NGMCC 1.201702 TaxID=3391825 RepID=UPI0039F0779A